MPSKDPNSGSEHFPLAIVMDVDSFDFDAWIHSRLLDSSEF
jgi:hypothetical protein